MASARGRTSPWAVQCSETELRIRGASGVDQLQQAFSAVVRGRPIPGASPRLPRPSLDALERLDIRENGVSGESIQVITQFVAHLPRLQSLRLANNPLGPGGVTALVRVRVHADVGNRLWEVARGVIASTATPDELPLVP